MEAYCVKCKSKKEMDSQEKVEIKGRGGVARNAVKGKCPVCGTTMFRIVAAEA